MKSDKIILKEIINKYNIPKDIIKEVNELLIDESFNLNKVYTSLQKLLNYFKNNNLIQNSQNAFSTIKQKLISLYNTQKEKFVAIVLLLMAMTSYIGIMNPTQHDQNIVKALQMVQNPEGFNNDEVSSFVEDLKREQANRQTKEYNTTGGTTMNKEHKRFRNDTDILAEIYSNMDTTIHNEMTEEEEEESEDSIINDMQKSSNPEVQMFAKKLAELHKKYKI